MVSDSTLIVAITTVGGSIAASLTIATLWIWRHTTNLHDKDIEKIEELREAEWDQAGEDLSEFIIKATENIDQEDKHNPRELRKESERIIEREIDEEELNQLVDAIQKVGQGRSLHRNHRKSYKKSYEYFAISLVIVILEIPFSIAVVLGNLFVPNGELAVVLFGLGGIMAALWGIKLFIRGRRKKEKFIESWEAVRLDD